MTASPESAQLPDTPAIVERLLANRREFLAFLEARVASRAVAEEILQSAFVRTLEKQDTLREEESAVAWFYRVLRNALTDHYRRNATRAKLAQKLASEEPPQLEAADLHAAVCKCVNGLLTTLKPEYGDLLQRIELQGDSLSAVATELGITPNNATVRLHRARQALRRQLERTCSVCATHGCLDCSCGTR